MNDVALPKAIQDQLDQAEAIERALAEQGKAAEPTPTPAAEPTPAPEPTPEPAAVQPEPAKSEPAKEPESLWEQRYKSLQGTFNTEMPKLQQQNRRLQEQLEEALRRIEELTRAKEPHKPAEQLVTKKDEDEFGADLVNMAFRVARQVFADMIPPVVGELRKEFGTVKEQVGHVAQRQAQSEELSFWDKVARALPDWEAVDQDPRWIAFLDTSPEFSPLTYRQLAQAAIEAGDVGKIVKLVAAWKATIAPPPAAPAPKQELSRQVAPPTTKGAPQPAQERIWTREEYERAYDPRTAATMSAAELEALQVEADRAVAEGRVRW